MKRKPYIEIRRDIAEGMLEQLRNATVSAEYACGTCGGVFGRCKRGCRLRQLIGRLEALLWRCTEHVGRYHPRARCGACLGCQKRVKDIGVPTATEN